MTHCKLVGSHFAAPKVQGPLDIIVGIPDSREEENICGVKRFADTMGKQSLEHLRITGERKPMSSSFDNTLYECVIEHVWFRGITGNSELHGLVHVWVDVIVCEESSRLPL